MALKVFICQQAKFNATTNKVKFRQVMDRDTNISERFTNIDLQRDNVRRTGSFST